MDIRRRVFTNLSRFKDHVVDFPPIVKSKREYQILLDLDSGLICFPEKVRSLRYRKQVQPLIRPVQATLLVTNHKDGGAHFKVLGVDKLDPNGTVAMTIDILNEMAGKIHDIALNRLPEVAILENLSSVYSQIARRGIEKLETWEGELTIFDAEKKLQNQNEGTYLLRKGTEVSFMINQMQENYGFQIYSYSLVFVGKNGKIGEHLILGIPEGWILYGDEPDLRKYTPYEDPLELLKTLGL